VWERPVMLQARQVWTGSEWAGLVAVGRESPVYTPR